MIIMYKIMNNLVRIDRMQLFSPPKILTTRGRNKKVLKKHAVAFIRAKSFSQRVINNEVILFTRYSLLVIFYSLLVIFYSLLVTRYFLLVTRYLLLVTRYFLLVTRYFLLVTRYFLLVTRYFLLVTSYFLLVTRYSLFFTRYGKESCVLINYVLIEKRVEKTGTR